MVNMKMAYKYGAKVQLRDGSIYWSNRIMLTECGEEFNGGSVWHMTDFDHNGKSKVSDMYDIVKIL